ncbi:MAG: hypothetical protein ACP5LX_06995, partial [Nitrososphaeria archaeon]
VDLALEEENRNHTGKNFYFITNCFISVPPLPNFACYWYKLVYNRMYWTITAKGLLPGFGV